MQDVYDSKIREQTCRDRLRPGGYDRASQHCCHCRVGRTLACASASMTAEKALNACVCVCVCERVCHSMCDPQDCGLGARAKPGQLPALSPKQNTCLLSKFIKASWVCPQRGQTGRLPPGRASSRGRVTRVGRGALGCRPPPRAPRSRPKAAPHAPRPRAPRA